MRQIRTRFSIIKENRVAVLRQQGYTLDTIAPIVNGSIGGVQLALKRFGRRWKFNGDRYCGRKRGFLCDAQIETIRDRYASGESVGNIAKSYELTYSTVYGIVAGKTYKVKEESGFPFDFAYRPSRKIL